MSCDISSDQSQAAFGKTMLITKLISINTIDGESNLTLKEVVNRNS